jgi:uncharacterized protein YciI
VKRFVYFYLNRASPEMRRVVPAHVQYWKGASLADYVGGPFADRTGGLISFSAPDLAAANGVVADDPFTQEDLISEGWLKEWVPE